MLLVIIALIADIIAEAVILLNEFPMFITLSD